MEIKISVKELGGSRQLEDKYPRKEAFRSMNCSIDLVRSSPCCMIGILSQEYMNLFSGSKPIIALRDDF